jgi:hypothetical protein
LLCIDFFKIFKTFHPLGFRLRLRLRPDRSLSATPQQVGIAAFTASALLQGIRGKLLQLHALRLAAAAKSAIADFRFKEFLWNS